MSWQPILEGRAHDRAWEAIRAVIADASVERADDADALTLFRGQPGVALLLAAVARETNDDALAERAVDCISSVASRAIEESKNLYFLTGLTGVVWTIERINELLDNASEEDEHAAIDEAVLELLEQPDASYRFELMKGLAGLGIYALERGPHPSAVRCVERVVAVLDQMAEKSPGRASWFTPVAQLPPFDAQLAPAGMHCLGIAHGVLGPIAVLAHAVRRGIADATARPLLEHAIAWLWEQRRREPRGSGWFGLASELPEIAGTQGWCYGDPGTAAVLFAAADAAGRADWRAMAIELAHDLAQREPATGASRDPMLCHGAAGVGHMLNRLHQGTGDVALREAAVAWFERALDLRGARGVGGFVGLEHADDRWVECEVPGLVDGSAGVALALLAAVTTREPRWDRALAIS